MGTGDDAFGGPRAGNIIYSSLDMVDNQTYNAGNGDANSGLGVFGVLYDLQVADDFTTTNDNVITNVTADYLTFIGANPQTACVCRSMTISAALPPKPPASALLLP
jgi:hypothetical protein